MTQPGQRDQIVTVHMLPEREYRSQAAEMALFAQEAAGPGVSCLLNLRPLRHVSPSFVFSVFSVTPLRR